MSCCSSNQRADPQSSQLEAAATTTTKVAFIFIFLTNIVVASIIHNINIEINLCQSPFGHSIYLAVFLPNRKRLFAAQ